MIQRMHISLSVLLGLVLTGCISTTPTFQTGPDAEVTFDGLTRVDGTAMDVTWARTDLDHSGYNKVIFDGVGIRYRPVKGSYSGKASTKKSHLTEFPLDDATKERLAIEIAAAFLEELRMSEQYEVVVESGPSVLLVRGELIDVVSNTPPDPPGHGDVWVSSIGNATLVLELRDSQSGAIFARAVDRQGLERPGSLMMRSDSVNSRAEVRRLGRRWGRVLRIGLESLLNSR